MKALLFPTIIGLSIICGCTSSRITSAWKTPEATTPDYRKIMVAGIIDEADRSMRERMEAHLLGDLKTLGYTVSSAYETYGPKGLEGLTEEQVNAKLAQTGIDAVVTVVLLDKKKERSYVPDRVVYSPYGYYHNRFYGYYQALSYRVGIPGYYTESTRYFWESNLYDLRSKKLVFSVQTQSFGPSSADAMAHEYGRLIIESMIKHGVIAKQKGATAAKAM